MRIATAILLLLTSCLAVPADQPAPTIKEKFRTLEVGEFTIEKGVELPTDYFQALPGEIVSEVQNAKLFDQVSTQPASDQQAQSSTTSLRLTGVVTAFHSGSRKGRYFGGNFNVGAKTQIYVWLRLIDSSTGALLDENEVVGTLSGGFGGGDSKNVIHEFSKSLVETLKLMILKPPVPMMEPSALASNPEQEIVEVSPETFDSALAKVNDWASKGYRLDSLKTTTYQTANLVMVRSGTTDRYEYVFYKAILPSNVQKELIRRSSENYRYRPHTLTTLKNQIFVIMERKSSAPAEAYDYRVHLTMLVSSSEKDVREDQAKGFTLIDCRKTMANQHLFILEKKQK